MTEAEEAAIRADEREFWAQKFHETATSHRRDAIANSGQPNYARERQLGLAAGFEAAAALLRDYYLSD